MVALTALVEYLNELLEPDRFRDYCPNGLQVEGGGEVGFLVSGVTASQSLIDAAVAAGADALLVHHGFFWKGENPVITGMKRRRIGALMEAGISLLAYHLPLDAHPEFGNNVQLARRLGFEITGRFGPPEMPDLAFEGVLAGAMEMPALLEQIGVALGREPLWIPGGPARVQRIGWCTGAAQSFIEQAADRGLDAFLSGEVSEQTTHVARECGIHFIGAGHHATERYGAEALGHHLAEHFDLEHRFIDIDNPA